MARPILSVIIPTLNEEAFIDAGLEAVLRDDPDEVIVTDGGSADGTLTRVRARPGVRLIESPAGRAAQMNAAARVARGDILLFCHADTILPLGYADAVRNAMADRRTAAGAFAFRLPPGRTANRVIELGVALRCRILTLPYGDQALFCRRADFEAVGGYPSPPAHEDVALVLALRGRGRCVVLPMTAVTSDRRWRRDGYWTVTARHYRMALRDAARRWSRA